MQTNTPDATDATDWLKHALTNVIDRLTAIDKHMQELARLDERVISHDKTLARFDKMITERDTLLHGLEVTTSLTANASDELRQTVARIQSEIGIIETRLAELDRVIASKSGSALVTVTILKWVFVIVSAVLTWHVITGLSRS